MISNFNVTYWSGSVDFNSVIHSCLDEIKEGNDIDDVETTLIKKVKKRLKKISIELKINNTFLICTDGLIPQAKMNDQRSRRYEFKNKKIEKIGDFYRSSITPRTKFMKRLDKEIRKYLQQEPLAPNVIYSSDEIIGEGEQKITEYYRDWSINKNGENHVIYGLDADLILLCLLSPLKYIYIKRENEKKYLDINKLRKELIKEFSHKYNKSGDILNDFLILTFFVGNDFIKRSPYFSDLRFGMDVLTEIYLDNRLCLTEDGEINFKELKRLFKILSKDEKMILEAASDAKHNKYQYYNSLSKFSQKWYDRCFLPRRPELLDIFEFTYSKEDISAMVNNYVEMFYWVFFYYTRGVNEINFNYSYKYYYSPLFYELYNLLEEEPHLYKKKTDIPSIATQTIYVLPPQISSIIDKDLASFYTNEKTDYMFPLRGTIDKDLKTETEIIYIFDVINKLDRLVRKKVGATYNHKERNDDSVFTHKFGMAKDVKRKTFMINAKEGYTKYYDRRKRN